ncbi:hypothetical protein Rruber_05470 (plasmid) [Rhodococcus ruber]|uniref:hypothetical protein n=1 Tax=Rhodococcus ruber TaxID=1830 RepID=UPI00315D9A3C
MSVPQTAVGLDGLQVTVATAATAGVARAQQTSRGLAGLTTTVDEDARVLDAYVRDHGLGGRSAGIRAALRMLGEVGLKRDYAAAFVDGGVEDDWDVTSAHGE